MEGSRDWVKFISPAGDDPPISQHGTDLTRCLGSSLRGVEMVPKLDEVCERLRAFDRDSRSDEGFLGVYVLQLFCEAAEEGKKRWGL